jgi:FKBP-type peptidyl-prolyl cis-trans isomerase
MAISNYHPSIQGAPMNRFILPIVLLFAATLAVAQTTSTSDTSTTKATKTTKTTKHAKKTAAHPQIYTAKAVQTSKASGPTKVTGKPQTTASGVEYWDIKVGTGATAVAGKTLTMHYTGWLTDGKKFDSSLDRGEPFQFTLGRGQVIKGWDEGVAGMKVGGKRQLKIPPAAGYGAGGAGNVIPPNATLIFDVELLAVK